ncbi:hypothetical protein [Kribbella sp. NBC_00889]|uniref:hypothetical protein n=1 Tax=Kribbella sp. NBC_00889 TaxID=2975974 RepID=UPI00386C6D5E|nr:hypothetical protein OG817_42875 [Kribbella sp. NBC_00889]
MPDRSRNRPRIAGQRRTPGTTPVADDLTTNDTEAVAEGVSPTTSDRPEVTVRVADDDELATWSDDEAFKLTVLDPETGEPAEQHSYRVVQDQVATGKRGLGVVLSVVLAVVVVLVLTVGAVLGIKAWQGKQAEDARDQAAAAGRKAAETALSYDYRDLDKSFAAARSTMTPDFAAKFDETAKVAGELATKTKATVKADVREVGVRDGNADRVTLIIFVNQTTTSTITKGSPRVDLNRTRFTMVRKDGRWLVQEIAGL